MGLSLTWPRLQVNLPIISNWQLGSASAQSPTITAGSISIPITQVVKGAVAATAVLKGPALGSIASSELEMPLVNLIGSQANTSGLGSSLVLGPVSPQPASASAFEGICIIGTPSGPLFQAPPASLVMFVPEAFLTLGPLSASTIIAVGISVGTHAATAIGQAGVDILAYRVSL